MWTQHTRADFGQTPQFRAFCEHPTWIYAQFLVRLDVSRKIALLSEQY
jgi:hypothetical protein